MNKKARIFLTIITAVGSLLTSSFTQQGLTPAWQFPYKKNGLTEREAAAHLLNRFTYSSTPAQIDEVVKMGLENWFNIQLDHNLADAKADSMLLQFPSLQLSNKDIVHIYPRGGQTLRMAVADGVINADSAKVANNKAYKATLDKYMMEKGLKPQAELFRQLVNQKIIRAAYSSNQLQEVMTDFWFNHFNVSISKGEVNQFVTSYERDVIRPNALTNFETLLLATAKSPAMLTYLDNNKSTAAPAIKKRLRNDSMSVKPAARNMQGLNENYAREIMELHTLGVDGGYTQSDVTQAAKVLTGWGLNPTIEYALKARSLPSAAALEKNGFVYDDNFLFSPNRHDATEKTILGETFPSGHGYDEGERLIHLLATHPSTAKFICHKLATRFVSDNPPQALVDEMAKVFLSKNGDIKSVLIAMVTSKLYWSKEQLREKTKSPFELAISSIRAVNAEVKAPFQIYQWVNKMGQKLYNFQAPTGFPDRGQYWINSGSLLNRMNFGLAFASGRIPGVKIDLLAINNNHEPESAIAALKVYTRLLLPERNTDETIKRLTPMINDPELQEKINQAADNTSQAKRSMNELDSLSDNGAKAMVKNSRKEIIDSKYMLAQVTGIIIGSPEFQRR